MEVQIIIQRAYHDTTKRFHTLPQTGATGGRYTLVHRPKLHCHHMRFPLHICSADRDPREA